MRVRQHAGPSGGRCGKERPAEVGCGGCEPSFKRLQVAPGLSSRFLTGPRLPTVRQKMFPLLAVELAVDGGMSAV
jgi:hypothetical protein